MDVNIGRLAAQPTHGGLVDEDAGTRQGEPLLGRSGAQQQSAHAGRLPDANRGHVGTDKLHSVIDGQAGGDGAAGRVDVKRDVALRVLGRQKQHLRDDEIGDGVVNWRTQKDNVIAQQARVDIIGAFAAAGLFHDHGHQHHVGIIFLHKGLLLGKRRTRHSSPFWPEIRGAPR